MKRHIVIVGGGPAGIFSAIRAGQLRKDVTLIEKNSILGRKLLLSGKGRCNITNTCDLNLFLKKFSKNGQFLRDAFKIFFNNDLISFFKKNGLQFKKENNLRIFPATNRADSILNALKKELCKNHVSIIFNAKMKDILISGSGVIGVKLDSGRVIKADRVILATGGLSYSFTGSDGYGLEVSRILGHSIVVPRPGIVPLEIKQGYPKILEGLTLRNIRLKFNDGKNEIFSEMGDILFTNFGISGPLVLSLSGRIVDWLLRGSKIYVEIDFKPHSSNNPLDRQLLQEFKQNPNKNIRNSLKNLLPRRLMDLFLELAEISPDKKVSQITQPERKKIISLLKGWRLDVLKPRSIEEAMITRGGVSLKDINPRTMESRIIKGLYFAGEMIDVDADTGGFNLQAAFSTGYLAGQSAALN